MVSMAHKFISIENDVNDDTFIHCTLWKWEDDTIQRRKAYVRLEERKLT